MALGKRSARDSAKTGEIVRKMYLKILPAQIFVVVVGSITSLVNGIVTGRFVGEQGAAAIGFFGPVATAIGLAYVLITGVSILCGKYIGSGERERVVSLFSTAVVAVTAFCAIIALGCFAFRAPLSLALGAKGETAEMLQNYIVGYAPAIVGQVLSGMTMSFLPLNNDPKRINLGIAAILVANVSLDILFGIVLRMGTLGMGLATSISYAVALAIMFPSFLGEGKAIRFVPKNFCFGELPRACVLGLPSLMFTVGCTAKGFIMNQTLATYVGDAAVAAMNVQGSVCAVAGAIPQGSGNAFLTLGSMYYGERDRNSLKYLMGYALKLGIIMAAIATALIMAGSGFIATWFYQVDSEAWAVTRRMLLLFPSFLVFNVAFTLFMKCYQCQERTLLVNILSAGENIIMAVFTVLFAPAMGADAVWLSFPAAEIICLLIIAGSVFAWAHGFTLKLEDWMKMPASFGAAEGDYLEFSVRSLPEVAQVSDTVMAFAEAHGLDRKLTTHAGLATEEMAANIVEHGFSKDAKKHSVDLRVVYDNGLTIRLRDDCQAFDPHERLNAFSTEDPLKNASIRMVASMAKDMTYYYNVGINTLIIEL